MSSLQARPVRKVPSVMSVFLVLLVVAALVAVAWLGLRLQPAPFPPYPAATTSLQTLPLPTGLPAPVERFYRKLYGERIPLITSVVITGRALIRPIPGGPALPARFRFTHEVGQAYRHYIEATWFGFPILRVNESYVDGRSYQEMPWGTVDNAPKANQAANLGMWAELVSAPSVYLSDPRVRWEAIDQETALLVVPFAEAEERFVVRFDSETGLVRLMETMRYREATEQAKKILWLAATLPGKPITVQGINMPAVQTATWLDVGKPWATLTTEEIVYNADVNEYVRRRGL